jgi:uncharacterized protein DUF5753
MCTRGVQFVQSDIGGAAVLREQLQHLIDVSRNLDNVELRIMPFSAGTHYAVGGNLAVLAFRDPAGFARPELVYVENMLSFVLQEDPSEVDLAVNVDEGWSGTARTPLPR